MTVRHRFATSLALTGAVGAWLTVALLFVTVSPVGNATVQLFGAMLLGLAVGLTSLPILWRASVTLAGGTTEGDWPRAARRAGLLGLTVALLVLLRALGAFSLPMALFVVGTAVLVELAFGLRH